MNEPKFRIGEEVIVLSRIQSPGRWLDEVIVSMKHSESDTISSQGTVFPAGWKYQFLDYSWASEMRIRKKHDPSTESFSTLLAGLKRPVGVAG